MPKHGIHSRFLGAHGSSSIPFYERPGTAARPRGAAAGGRGGGLQLPVLLLLALAAAWAASLALLAWRLSSGSRPQLPRFMLEPVLISYAYFEKDAMQLANFEYFLAVGSHYPALHADMHWAVVVSGERCTPCSGLYSMVPGREPGDLSPLGIKEVRFSAKFSLLVRSENVGMDLGAHNVTLEWLGYRGQLGRYAYYIFLNSSVKGPFLPAWVPPEWHWAYAFLAAFQPGPEAGAAAGGGGSNAAALRGHSQQASARASFLSGGGATAGAAARPVHAVGSSLVCLPRDDAGGPGARLESWAFALDQPGLAAAIDGGAFTIRGCKLCADADSSIVVGGEYGLSVAQFSAGYNIATLLSRYARGTDWSDPQHWACNDNVHPSRAGLYDGISVHPYETVFVKSSWHVAEPYTKRYSQWQLQHLLGKAGTEGTYNQRLYKFGVSRAAEQPHDLEAAYRALAAAAAA